MTDIETWHPSQSPLAIEYARALLDEVRDQTTAGFRRLSRGGVEVGGILYGTRDENKVRILATRPITCEYRSGPSFVLSEKDKHRLLDQLTGAQGKPPGENLCVVGWYVSHPRGSVTLTDADLEIYNEFFPASWNVTLVLQPTEKSIRCGFFVREARGSLNLAQSYQEFEIALPRSAEGSSAVRQIADQVASSLAAQRNPEGGLRRAGARGDVTQFPAPAPRQTTAANGSAAATAAALEASPGAWSTAVARPRSAIIATTQNRRGSDQPRRLKWGWLVGWMISIALLIGAAYGYHEFTAPAPLGLRVAEKDGDLIIQWDPTARPLRWATNGKIEVKDSGQTKTQFELSEADLATGRHQVASIEGDSSIRLTIHGKFGFRADESTRYVGQAAAQSSEPSALSKPVEMRDRRKLQAEVRRLRDELDRSRSRVQELESLLYNR